MKTQRFFKQVLPILVLYTTSLPAQTPPVKQWDKRFGGSDVDAISLEVSSKMQIIQTKEGGYLAAGSSKSNISGDKTQNSWNNNYDYWIVKCNSNGSKLWDKRFGGDENDALTCVQQTSDGGYILGGYSFSGKSGNKTEGTRGNADYWIVKTDSTGVIKWNRRLGGTNSDQLQAILQTSDGGYILAGTSFSGNDGDKRSANWGLDDYWIVKTDSLGYWQWDVSYGGELNDYLSCIVQTSDGYLLGGSSNSPVSGNKTSVDDSGGLDFWVVKINNSGQPIWDGAYGSYTNEQLFSMKRTLDGGYILGGTVFDGVTYEYQIVKIFSDGLQDWLEVIGGNGDDNLRDIFQTNEGEFILGGFSYSGISGWKKTANKGAADYWILKTESDGTYMWDVDLGAASDDQLFSFQPTDNGGYVLFGTTRSLPGGDITDTSRGNWDYWIVKLGTECTATKPTITSVPPITTNLCPGKTATLNSSAATATYGIQEQIHRAFL